MSDTARHAAIQYCFLRNISCVSSSSDGTACSFRRGTADAVMNGRASVARRDEAHRVTSCLHSFQTETRHLNSLIHLFIYLT
jgi:hypothetical protein